MLKTEFFYGTVEQVSGDPLDIGRVKVRVHGAHEPSPQKLPVEFLPWAIVMLPATSASNGEGVGRSPTGLVIGSEVMGITLDSSYNELRVLFSWCGLNSGTPEMNPLTINKESELANKIETQRLKDIKISTSKTIDELETERAVEYPLNDVETSRSGFVTESDSSNGSRVTQLHPTGNYKEWRTDGSFQSRVKSFISVAMERSFSVFRDSWFISVIGNMVTKIDKDFYQLVSGQVTEVSVRGLLKFSDSLEIDTSEIRASGDIRIAKTLYVNEIRVKTLKADSISCSSIIDGVSRGATQAGIAGSLSTPTLTTGSGAGDVSVGMKFDDNGGDY